MSLDRILRTDVNPLTVGDTVELFDYYGKQIDPGSVFEVIANNGNYTYSAIKYHNDRTYLNASFSQSSFTWLKVIRAEKIKSLILPGKPLIITGVDPYKDHRVTQIRQAISSLGLKERYLLTPNSILMDLDLDFLRHFIQYKCVDSVIVIAGIPRLECFPNWKQINRVLAYLMRNKKRRIVLTGEYFTNQGILNLAANHIKI